MIEALGGLEIESGGERLVLLPSRAAWWPERSTLLAADLHLGKAETFRAVGSPLPPGTVSEPLERLDADLAATGAERVLILGDLLHAPAGLTDDLVETVASWRAGSHATLELIPGNHDRRIDTVADAWRLTIRPTLVEEGGLLLVHDPEDAPLGDERPIWCGHIHPAVRLGSGLGKLPCFAVSDGLVILPAFSRFTGGKPIGPSEWRMVGVVAEDRVVRLG